MMDEYEGFWVNGWDEAEYILGSGDGLEVWFGKGIIYLTPSTQESDSDG